MPLLHPSGITSRKNGMTLLEVMVAMVVLTVGLLGFMSSFSTLSKMIRTNKARAIANNLASEKIESLKNDSYHRLLVTTAPVTATEVSGVQYDTGYYPSETVRIGQIEFTRRILIQKVTESSGTFVINDPFDQDTGVKLITVHVLWQRRPNEWAALTVTNLRDNPARETLDSTITGTITSGGTNIQNALVQTLQNPLYSSVTSAAGSYSFKVPNGSYTVTASRDGYFPATKTTSVADSASTTLNFNLTKLSSGSVSGMAYLNNHLLISKICGSVDGDDQLEYVELYNPTSQAYTMMDTVGTSYQVQYIKTSDGTQTDIDVNDQTIFVQVPSSIPAFGYYLIASSPVVKGVTADAYYSDASLVASYPANRIPLDESGGIRLVSRGVYETSGTIIDALGWGDGSSPYGPSNAREGTGFQITTGGHGLQTDYVFERMAYSSSTHSTMDVAPSAGVHASFGNAYDTNMSSTNWVIHTHTDNDTPQNSSTLERPQSGTPAAFARVFVDDGLSSSVVASSSGSFKVTSVATGTWTVLVSTAGYTKEWDNVTVTASASTNLGNVAITTTSSYGILSGRVINSAAAAVPNITVNSAGKSDITDTAGYYNLQLGGGTYTVKANENNANSNYTVGDATGVICVVGQITTVDDISIVPGGVITGFVSTNGIDPLPDIPIVSISSTTGAEITSTLSNSLGRIQFNNLPTGTYSFAPQLLSGESSSPSTKTGTVVAGTTVSIGTFTITNAYGAITGTVKSSGQAIDTGVLIVAVSTVAPITSSNPPTLNSALFEGTTRYYLGSSNSDGTYELSLPGGTSYYVYSWYTTISSTFTSTSKKSTSVAISPGTSTTYNFTWP